MARCLTRFEVGIVSADRALVDFLAEVFGLDERPPMENPAGTLHRLEAPGAVIKVMVPSEPPKSAEGEPFLAVQGIRYLTMWVSDFDGVIERCTRAEAAFSTVPSSTSPVLDSQSSWIRTGTRSRSSKPTRAHE